MKNISNLTTITIVKDDVGALLKTLKSVSVQVRSTKHLVVDGSSRLQNQNLIRAAAEEIGSQYIFQEARGIYSAMNFALEQCNDDEMVLFLNAGDYFAEEISTKKIVADIEVNENDIYLYNCFFGELDGFIPKIDGANAQSVAKGKALVCHQGVVASVGLIRRAGMFDETYAISADHKLLLRMLQLSQPKILETAITVVSLGGVSDLNCAKLAKENSRARHETGLSFESKFVDKSYTYYRIVRCKSKLVLRRVTKFIGLPNDVAQKIIHRRK